MNIDLLLDKMWKMYTSYTPSANQISKLFNEEVTNDHIAFRTFNTCLLYTSPSPRDRQKSRMPSSA